jgi:subtilase family serine protease
VPGVYYIIAKTDGPDLISETNETNNTRSAGIIIGPDLSVLSVSVPLKSGVGAAIKVTHVTVNSDGGDAPASTTGFYLSTDSVLDAGDLKLSIIAVPALAAGATSTGTSSLTISLVTGPGTYYIIAKANGPDLISEADMTNNTKSASIIIGPDLSVSSLTAPAGAGAGAIIIAMDTTKNSGGGYAGLSRTKFYLSADSVLDGSDVLLGRRPVPSLAAGAGSTGTTSLTIPLDTAAGYYHIIAKADGPGLISETNETNNARIVSIRIGPDLIVSSLTVPSGAEVGAKINAMYVTKNNPGGGDAPASTTCFYLSKDKVLTGSDILLKSKAMPALAAGASSTGTISLTIPSGTVQGTYYIIVKADGLDLISEANETNNIIYKQITVQ